MNKNDSNGSGIGKMAVGLTAVAAGIGIYLLYGSKKGAKRRRVIKSWMLRMRADVLEELEGLKEVTEDAYYRIVEKVRDRYRSAEDVTSNDLDEVVDELKDGWEDVVDTAKDAGADVASAAKDSIDGEVKKAQRKMK